MENGKKSTFKLNVERYERGGRKGWRVIGNIYIDGKRKRIRKCFTKHPSDEENQQAAIGYRKQMEGDARKDRLEAEYRETTLTSDVDHTIRKLLRKTRTEIKDFETSDEDLIEKVFTYYIDSPTRGDYEVTVKEACEEFVSRPKFKKRQKPTRDRYHQNLKHLVGEFGDRQIGTITELCLHDLIYEPEGEYAQKSRYDTFRALWNWTTDQRYTKENVVVRIDTPDITGRTHPKSLSIPQLKSLLQFADRINGGSVIPYVVFGTFCAMRPKEIHRAKWEHIHWEDKVIHVRQNKAGSSIRPVEIPNLAIEWLKYFDADIENRTGNVCPANIIKNWNLTKICAGFRISPGSILSLDLCGLDEHTKNCDDESRPEYVTDYMRHTGITYRKKLGDLSFTEVAEWAGNSEPVIKKHYKSVIGVTNATNEEYWSLTPESLGLTKAPFLRVVD